MSGGMKNLAKETIFYGVGSVLPKLLSWLLSLYWAFVLPRISDIGVLTNFYAWVALLQVTLTYGMETGYFRFANKEKDPEKVFSTTFISILSTTLIFFVISLFFLEPAAFVLGGTEMKPHWLLLLITILCIDVIGTIPFAKLRFKKRPIRFATIKILNVVLIILFNLFFFLACPWLQSKFPGAFSWFDINNGVDYILISNLSASVIQFLMVSPELRIKFIFDKQLLQQMLKYSFPILILGIAGILNQTVDKIVFPWFYPNNDFAFTELGIYGQNFKIAVIMVMFTQAFRYAFEPFIFARNRGSYDDKQSFSDATKYFIIFGLLILLAYSYMACAWASFFANFIMMVISYFMGQKNYPIPYNLKSAGFFFMLSMLLFAGITVSYACVDNLWVRLSISTALILLYLLVVIKKELPLTEWPVIGNYLKKNNPTDI